MGTPQVIYLVLMGAVLAVCAVNDGKPRGPYSFWGAVTGAALWTTIVWWGGFFS